MRARTKGGRNQLPLPPAGRGQGEGVRRWRLFPHSSPPRPNPSPRRGEGPGRRSILVLPLAALALVGAAPRTAVAYFAGGCFWSNETDMDRVPGVISTTSGYAGGHVRNPTYEQVSQGNTGHLETVRVVYDPARISYASLVDRFFHTMDPTDAGGQFCDRGPEYHTAVFVRTPEERRIALAVRAREAQVLHTAIATQVLPINGFYPAEDYHQDFARRNPVRYRLYRAGCGRDARVAQVWGRSA